MNVRSILRSMVGILLGLNFASIALFCVDSIGDSFFPFPQIPFDDKTAFLKWIQEIPNGKLLFFALTSIITNLVGGFISSYYSKSLNSSYFIGIFFSFYHFLIIRRCLDFFWFFYFNFLLQIPSSYYGGLIGMKL